MGTEPSEEQPTPESLQHQLDAETVTFVDTLSEAIATRIETAPALQFDYLVGEVSDYGVSSNGHAHFDLSHADTTIHCVCFRGRRPTIDADLDDGTQVAVAGECSYYAAEGSCSIIVDDVVALGVGRYQQRYEQNRQLLADDGLLDPATKQSLPDLPRRIGLVTSADSDARTDAVTSIHDRHPGVDIVVSDTPVQGDDALPSLLGAISALDDDATVDVIVVTRGGGADTQLRLFNETPLCRVLHNTDTPVVVAVGHEDDRSLAGDVADERVMTPTQVGQIVPSKQALDKEYAALATGLDHAYRQTVATQLADATDRLDRAYHQRVRTRLRTLETALDHAFETHATARLADLEHRLDAARAQHDHQRQYRQQTAQHRRQRRRLRLALVILGLVVLALMAVLLFT